MIRKATEIATISWTSVVVLRAWDFPFTGIALILTSVCTVFFLFGAVIKGENKRERSNSLILLLLFISVLPKTFVSYHGTIISFFGATCCLALIAVKAMKRLSIQPSITFWLIALISIPTGILPATNYHGIFRAGTYESYVTRRFEAGSEEAVRLISAGTPSYERDTSLRKRHLEAALIHEKAKNHKESLSEYDLAIASDPYDAASYVARGRFRLYNLELTDDVKHAAIKDFTNAIRLDSSSASAYFYRAQTKSCLEPQPEFCKDLETAIRLDTVWKRYALETGKIRCPQLLRSLAPR